MKHRILAFGILGLAAWLAVAASRRRHSPQWIRGWAVALLVMVTGQIVLGAWTVWSNKAADIATAHMALGALTLFFAGRVTFRCFAAEKRAAEHALEFPSARIERAAV